MRTFGQEEKHSDDQPCFESSFALLDGGCRGGSELTIILNTQRVQSVRLRVDVQVSPPRLLGSSALEACLVTHLGLNVTRFQTACVSPGL